MKNEIFGSVFLEVGVGVEEFGGGACPVPMLIHIRSEVNTVPFDVGQIAKSPQTCFLHEYNNFLVCFVLATCQYLASFVSLVERLFTCSGRVPKPQRNSCSRSSFARSTQRQTKELMWVGEGGEPFGPFGGLTSTLNSMGKYCTCSEN